MGASESKNESHIFAIDLSNQIHALYGCYLQYQGQAQSAFFFFYFGIYGFMCFQTEWKVTLNFS